jgi:hypothetical protein
MGLMRWILILGIWWFVASTPAWAQAEPAAGESEVAPAAISLSKIGEEADRTKTRLEEINFVSGLILMVERPVKVGDTVEVGALLGEVAAIGLRASRLRTLQHPPSPVPGTTARPPA